MADTTSEKHEIKIPPISMYLICAAVVAALTWVWWAIENFTEFRVVRFGRAPREDPVEILFPIVVTPLAFVVGVFWWSRSAGIAKNGVYVEATIESLAGGMSGMRDIYLTYVYEGQSFRKKVSVSDSDLDGKQLGDPLRVVVDKRNPRRVVVQ